MLRDLPDGSILEQIVFRYIVEKYELPQEDVDAALDIAKEDGGTALMGTIAETWKQEGKAEAEGITEGEAKSLMCLGEAVWTPTRACGHTDSFKEY